jgi:8-oxo-dGTP pyrophosphatase MutT (NUDIX family)
MLKKTNHHNQNHSHRDWNKRKKIICKNCDCEGHVHRNCKDPITSFGIIAIKSVDWKKVGKHNETICVKNLEYFMVQRRCTMGFIDFLRGTYTSKEYLNRCLVEMTLYERKLIGNKKFEYLWDNLWMNHDSKVYINSFLNAKDKFSRLNIQKLLRDTSSEWTDTEYGFPKGRKNLNESNLQCAIREFKEESGFKKDEFKIQYDLGSFEELFKGTNGIMYRHVYYIAFIENTIDLPIIDKNDISQIGEIKKLGWYSFDECLDLIRFYDYAKKDILTKVDNVMKQTNLLI